MSWVIERAQNPLKSGSRGKKNLVLHYQTKTLPKRRASMISGHDFYGLWVERQKDFSVAAGVAGPGGPGWNPGSAHVLQSYHSGAESLQAEIAARIPEQNGGRAHRAVTHERKAISMPR